MSRLAGQVAFCLREIRGFAATTNSWKRAVSRHWLPAAALLVPGSAFALDQPAWRAVVGHDPLQDKIACLVESAEIRIHDGQTETPVRFLYNGTAFLVTTESNIDLSYPNVGLQVDTHAPFAVERIHEDTNVIFASDAAQITAQFTRGLQAQLALGFWPTWPRGDTVVADFSLIGFTKALGEYRQCQQTGRIGEGAEGDMRP